MSTLAQKLWRYARGVLYGLRGWRLWHLAVGLGGSQWVVRRLDVTQTLLGLLRPNTHFLDVGANLGYFSLLAAVQCPRGRVFAIEPDPQNFRLLSASVALNGLRERLTAVQTAASDEDGLAMLSDLGNAANRGARFTAKSRAALKAHVHGPAPTFTEVRMARLDRLLAGECIDVMKMDAEGHEPLALRGAEGILRAYHPAILLEFSPGNIINIVGEAPEVMLQFLRGLGYGWQVIGDDGSLGAVETDPTALVQRLQVSGEHHADLLLIVHGK